MAPRSRVVVDEDEEEWVESPPPPPRRKKQDKSSSSRDAYGFKLQLKGQQRQERQECSTSAQALLPDWSFVPQGLPYPGTRKLKKLVRKGVPPEYRGSVWMEVSGSAAMQAAKPTTYYRNLADAEHKCEALHQIELVGRGCR